MERSSLIKERQVNSLLGIVVCTHSNFAAGIHDALTMIAGPQDDFEVMGFQTGEDMLEYSERLKAIAQRFEDRKQPYVFVVDLFGATPFNASAAALSAFDTTVISGVNLPLLLELVLQREHAQDIPALLETAVQSAKDSIQLVKMREMFNTKG